MNAGTNRIRHLGVKLEDLTTKARNMLYPYEQVVLNELRKVKRALVALDREFIARAYIEGNGIEIGALHLPLAVSKRARVKYVDRMSVSDLRGHYPELAELKLMPVSIVDNGETLANVGDETQDFVIANHFLEHCQDPIRTISNMLRVLKGGGVLYLAVPDKRYTFDIDRPVTTIEHVFRDYQEGPDCSKRQHFEEWVKLVEKIADEGEVQRRVEHLIDIDLSIHYHVWSPIDLLHLIIALRQRLNFPFELELFFRNDRAAPSEREAIAVLRKRDNNR